MGKVLFGPEGLQITQWLREGRATVVKQGPHRVVYRVALPDGQSIYIKHNLLPDARAWLRQLVRPSKARIELERVTAVAERGVATVVPLALGERRALFGACESYLITRGLDDTQSLNTFLATTLASMPHTRQAIVRQRLAKVLGRFVAKMHDGGIRHNDLHAANILVELNCDDQPRLFLIDLCAVKVSAKLDWRASSANLVLLARWFFPRSSRGDRLRFWRTYFEARGMGIWPRGSRGHREHFVLARQLENATRSSLLAFWKHRDDRCREHNRHYHRICRPGLVGHAIAGFDNQVLKTLLADPDAPFKQPGTHLLKDSPSSTVAEVEYVIDGVSRRLIYKRIYATGWKDPLTSLVRPTAALRSWTYGHGFRERCLPTPRSLVVLQRTRAGLPHDGYLLTEKLEDSVDLHHFVAGLANLRSDQARRQLRMALDAVARAIRRLHHWHMSQRDLKASNLFVATSLERLASPFMPIDGITPGAPIASLLPLPASQVHFIDLAGIRLYTRLPRRRRVQNLARLNASFHQSPALTRTDKLRFLRAYLMWNLVGRANWKSWWRQIERATERKLHRNAASGRVLH
jgi:hypothetical protein